MNCDLCTQEFVDDQYVITNFLMHMIIRHGEEVNNKDPNLNYKLTMKRPDVSKFKNSEELV